MFVPGATAQPAGATALALPLVGGAQCLERRKPTRAPAREEAPGDLGARLPCRGKPKARGGRGSSRGTSTRHPSCMKSHQTGTCWPLLYSFSPSYCSIPLSGRRRKRDPAKATVAGLGAVNLRLMSRTGSGAWSEMTYHTRLRHRLMSVKES